jgi:3-isopropylmalate/(R)-2-methylmalate dehydratase small subunit
MKPFSTFESAIMVLEEGHIDTDQIIPARFLTTTSREGLADAAFADWRFDAEGQPKKGSPFSDPRAGHAQILVAGDNFGCGSSREHAPWALQAYGFRAVVAPGIADIFRNNALKNGLLAIDVTPDFHQHLSATPWQTVALDLNSCEIATQHRTEIFQIDPFARHCLLNGQDHLDFLLQFQSQIQSFEEKRA